MEAIRMYVSVFRPWGMVLHNAILTVPKDVFYLAHFFPCRTTVGKGYGHMFPSPTIAGDDGEALLIDKDLEVPVVPVICRRRHRAKDYPSCLGYMKHTYTSCPVVSSVSVGGPCNVVSS